MKKTLILILYFLQFAFLIRASEIPLPSTLADERIYSIITSRFYDADPENNFYNYEQIEDGDPHYRGDFKGIAAQLPYIKELGFTAICITPPIENRGGLDYMGFNGYDWLKFEPRLSSSDFCYYDLIKEAKLHGIKIIQTLVVNHCCNYGIRNLYFIPRLPIKFYRGNKKPIPPYYINFGNYKHPYRMDNDNPMAPEWFKDYLVRDQWGAGPLIDPVTGASFPQDNLHPERFFGTNEKDLSNEYFFTEGWLTSENILVPEKVQRNHLSQNQIALATQNQAVRDYFLKAVKYYINLGIDGIRIQFARNTPRHDLRYMVDSWLQLKPELIVFADVAPVESGFGKLSAGSKEPSELVPWWYTTSSNDAKDPSLGQPTGISVMDYPLFNSFAGSIAIGHFNSIGDIIRSDWIYPNPTELVTFFHNYDIGPETGHLTRFSQDSWKAACAYNLIWTIRGAPMLLMGEEIEFQRGMPQVTILPDDKLSQTGKAYFGDNLTHDNIATTKQHQMFKHIKRLNMIRAAVPALSKGTLENGNEFVTGISFVRNYKNGMSYVVVGLSAFIEQNITVNRILPGNYTDAITGDTIDVATTSRSISFDVKANSAGIWILNGPGKIGEDTEFLH